jgi:pimeloyl-ACP methyl ester carboxylesterase
MALVYEKLVDVGAGQIQVDSSGDGPDFVILHSLLTGPEAFDHVASVLSRELTVHRIYLPGFGNSTPLPSQDLSVADLGDVVVAALGGLGCGPDTTVLGNGLGSFVALTLATRHGDWFEDLIVSNTGPGFPDDRQGAFLTMSELAICGGMSAVADMAVKRIFPPDYLEAHPEAAAERRTVLEAIDPGAFAAACRALARLDLGDELSGIRNRTLVVVGQIDQTTPPEMGLAVAEAIPGAISVEIRGCGHCPQLERPEALLAAVESFLTGRNA